MENSTTPPNHLRPRPNTPILKQGVTTAKDPQGFDREKAIKIHETGDPALPVYEIRSTKGTVLWRGLSHSDGIRFRNQVPIADFINR